MKQNPAIFVGAYLLFALFICFPAPFGGQFIGHEDVDVWNHVWGFWYVLDALASGSLPWRTELLNAPEGGVLYFVDPVGASMALPFSVVFGVGGAYTLVQILRVALAGMLCHLLCQEVSGRGPHAWIAGLAFASCPFLLAEMGNGISEVTAIWWTPLCLWRAAVAFRTTSRRDWFLLGLVQGLCTLASFYYGLGTALLIGIWFFAGRHWDQWRSALLAAMPAIAIPLPFFSAFRASLGPGNSEALIQRSGALNHELLVHNAVDPREYFFPGGWESVDYQTVYGEAFVHTAFLRLSLIGLALWAVWKVGRAARIWLVLAVVSLVLGLGRALFWGGDFVGSGQSVLLLPFGWLQELVPQLAITHSSRLALGAQAIFALLAAWAMVGQSRRRVALVCVVVVGEALFFSPAHWPLPRSSASVPGVYEEIARTQDPLGRAVLDLPAEVGTTMASSRYFWFQTVHQKPVPYSPDIRVGSSSDARTFVWLQHAIGPVGQRTNPRVEMAVEPQMKAHLKERYGWVILHRDLASRAGLEGLFEEALKRVLGSPQEDGDLIYWRL